jgi:hypothetical protein
MSDQLWRPDPEIVLDSLKDFQRRTVDYVFRRLYTDPDRVNRFLVADEVGLGKTLVARGLIARVLDHLWDDIDRIDIVYICSNADIARQNVNRLITPGLTHSEPASRITLLPITIQNLKENKVNFVSFTPSTSFNLRSAEGIGKERALLYWMLRDIWGLSGTSPLNVLQGGMYTSNFRDTVRDFRRECTIDEELMAAFGKALGLRVQEEIRARRATLQERFDELCGRFRYARKHIPQRDRDNRQAVVGELRQILAETCLDALEPDLIILDEFQRFKDLFTGSSEASELAQSLINYKGAATLLLSATPYKMYTIHDEAESENHYEDFLGTLGILFDNDAAKSQAFEEALYSYRRALFRLKEAGDEYHVRLLAAKRDVEHKLRQVMVRTERLAVTDDRNGMLEQVTCAQTQLEVDDLVSYLALEQLSAVLDQPSVLEFWKSAPYLLNFMESHYQLKKHFEEELGDPATNEAIHRILSNRRESLLSWADIEAYRRVDPANARLRQLWADMLDSGAWQLLWLPPVLSYYQLDAPFSQVAAQNFTKRLVFSSWHVVPKVVASLLSYEAERRMVTLLDDEPENSTEARKRRGSLLRFAHGKDDRLTGMPVLGLMYPSSTLANACDPLDFAAQQLTLAELRDRMKARLADLLASMPFFAGKDRPVDETWYWATPILLDLQAYPEATKAWLQDPALASSWAGTDVEPDEEEDTPVWAEHVTQAKRLSEGNPDLGRMPDDLLDVLVDLALAGPGVVALRSMTRVASAHIPVSDLDLRVQAATVAWAFRSLFNVPEVVALLRGLNRDIPYWRQVLAYSAAGGLQAVMDEYSHVLREALGLLNPEATDTIKKLAEGMRAAIQIRPAQLKVDDIQPTPEGIQIFDRRLRTHFALRYGDHRSDDDRRQMRKEQVREAFNSPFWPFVLVSTSVGQEGLDFHLYCHAVVHWNLPGNPVDLEQREGRVHRYKGHAVRKNVAHVWRSMVWETDPRDPWQALFDLAQQHRQLESTDLVPYWIYPDRGEGPAVIERHVPALPLSKDQERLVSLRRSMAVYRMAFGQNRQEDVIEYLVRYMPVDMVEVLLSDAQISLEPPVG